MKQLVAGLGPGKRRVLDVGCGHGRFAALLHERDIVDAYLGVDASPALLEIARSRDDLPPCAKFGSADVVADPGSIPTGPFDLIVVFGVLHHVPSEARRIGLVRILTGRLAPGGTLAVAIWRIDGDADHRRVDWSHLHIDEDDLEPGDRLQTFDGRLELLRYAHFADDTELDRIAAAPDLPLSDRFEADGGTGVANAYLLWTRPDAE